MQTRTMVGILLVFLRVPALAVQGLVAVVPGVETVVSARAVVAPAAAGGPAHSS